MTIAEITATLEEVAPLSLQESYDNAGLQVGNRQAEATGALLCIDITQAVVEEAIALGVNLVIAHHPLLFKGVKSLTGSNYIERTIALAIKHDIALYAAHTNLDNAYQGVNYKIAQKLGLTQVRPLVATTDTPHGSGVIGIWEEPLTSEEFLQRAKSTFAVPAIKHSRILSPTVQTVAIVGGAGGYLAQEAANQKCDAFITGEIRYHDYFMLDEAILLVEAGHYETEQYTKEVFCEIIRKKYPNFATHYTSVETNPINYL